MIEYREAKLADVVSVVERLRAEDRFEVEASSGKDARTAVLLSLEHSKRTTVATVNGRPECIFGLGELTHKIGVPWMLGTDEVPRHARALLIDAKRTVAKMHEAYPYLTNFVHAENTHSILWLKRLGFEFLPAAPHGAHQQLFLQFVRQRNV